MDAAQPRKARILKAWNHFKNRRLRPVLHLGLKTDDIVERAKRIVAAQLHDGMRFHVGLMRIGQAHGFHRTVPQGFAPAFGHHFDGQASVEIARCFAFVKLGFLGGEKRVDESLVLIAVHRTIEIGGALLLGLALVVARLHPRFCHVDAFGIDDGRNRIKERQRLSTGFFGNGLTEGGGRERTGRDDPASAVGQGGDLALFNADAGVGAQGIRDRLGKRIAVHGQGAACRQAMAVGGGHDQPARKAHFPMQQTHSILFIIVGSERVGTYHFAKQSGAMGKGADLWAHLVDHDVDTGICSLPRGLGTGHAATDDVQFFCHGPQPFVMVPNLWSVSGRPDTGRLTWFRPSAVF